MPMLTRSSAVDAPDLSQLLDCIAISDSLDGMLLFGADASTLEFLTEQLTKRLLAAGKPSVDRVWLGSTDTEDTLWGANLPPGWGGRGLLVPPDHTTRIVIVPDLSHLSLAAARAGVMTLGASTVEVQRRGQAVSMPVRHRWLAALAGDDAGNVSRHLIDRFSIQVHMPAESAAERCKSLGRRLTGCATPSPQWQSRVKNEPSQRIRVLPEATDQAMSLVHSLDGNSLRSSISLLHVARALARLGEVGEVSPGIVVNAGKALGLRVSADSPMDEADLGPKPDDSRPAPNPGQRMSDNNNEEQRFVKAVPEEAVITDEGSRTAKPDDILVSPDSKLDTLRAPVDSQTLPSPPPPRKDYALLRLPWQQSREARNGRGAIIGTRRADTLQDLAIPETLLAAAPFQQQRRAELNLKSDRIVLVRSDLRSYRRVPPSGELLVIVLDYTSVAGVDWLGALVPFLAEAYAARAQVCVVRVGASSAMHTLRADQVMARNILVRSFVQALDEVAGVATPLADGLYLALRTIQQTLERGRTSTRRATLIVVTDGRGNVTLADSRAGKWSGPVGRLGIDDARQVARDLRALKHVRRVLINPQPTLLADLPLGLAAALDAEVVRVEVDRAS